MLPGRGLLRAFGGEGDAYGAILASWALGPPQCKEGMRGFMGRGGAAGSGIGRTGTAGGGAGGCGCCGAGARRCGGTALVGAARGGDGGHGGRGSGGCCGAGAPLVGTTVRVLRGGGATVRGHGAAADATLVTALELTAQQARWKRVTVGCGESGLTRRNTPARVAAIRPNWRALPQRALRALR